MATKQYVLKHKSEADLLRLLAKLGVIQVVEHRVTMAATLLYGGNHISMEDGDWLIVVPIIDLVAPYLVYTPRPKR